MAKLIGEPEIGINPENKNQVTEISNVKWFDYSEAIFNIRPYNTEKRDVLKKFMEFFKKKLIINNMEEEFNPHPQN